MPDTPAPHDALVKRLLAGNRRYAARQPLYPNLTLARRQALAAVQHPFATILTCADSRIAPELVFDRGMGDLFVVRIAGNIITEHVLATVEFSVQVVHVPLVMVMGHTNCGAIISTLAGGELPGHLPQVGDLLQMAITQAREQPGDLLLNTIHSNARLGAAQLLERSPLLAEHAQQGRLRVLAACYDMASGLVELLD